MKLVDVVFLEPSDVEEGHAEGLAVGGGTQGVRDAGLLVSAVMTARTGYYGSLAELAAAYAFGIVKNHAFVDGNKRAGLFAAVLFLEINGYPLTLEREKWRVIIEGVAAGEIPRTELVRHFVDAIGDAVAIESDT